MWNWLEWYVAHWIRSLLISCDMLYHHVVSCMIFNWPVPKLQLIHWSRDALWLMVWYCHIIQLLYAQAIQCIIHPFHRLYTAWRPSAIIQSSTLKPGDHRLERALSTIHLCSVQVHGSGCYTYYLMHLRFFIQANNSKTQWSSCWPCAISCAQVYTFQGAADAAWNLCRTMIKALCTMPCQ